ncbi:MAG: hypothetical protein J6B29_00045 [Clostridia bacterium]|nr:hypothetical protein [Clostridia bacterium]
MKRIIWVLALLVLCIGLSSCDKSLFDENYVYDGTSLLGKWQSEDKEDGYYYSYEFFDNGKVEWKEYSYGIEFSVELREYTAQGHEITLKATRYDGTVSTEKNKFTITEDGKLVIVYLDADAMTEKESVLVPFENDFNEDADRIFGSWEDRDNPGEIWSFNEDFSGSIADDKNSYTIYYSVKDKRLYIAYEFVPGVKQSLVQYDMDLDGDTLSLKCKIEGETVKYVLERK